MKLADARKRKLLSVRRLAKSAGVSPTTISTIELGKSIPGFLAIRKISEALDIDPLDIDEFAAVIEGTGAGKVVAALYAATTNGITSRQRRSTREVV